MSEITRPAASGTTVTASDSVQLEKTTRGLYVGGDGDVAVKFPGNGSPITFASVPAGSILPIQVDFVMAAGTSATGIVALF